MIKTASKELFKPNQSLYNSFVTGLSSRLKYKPNDEPTGTLSNFVSGCWPIIEPGQPYISGWHIDAISELLEAASRYQVLNFIINMPPRHMKSTLVTVAWMCWTWTWFPESRWLFASYGDNLSARDSVKCRRIIQSQWYQHHWGDTVKLVPDQNQKTRFENTKMGYRIATTPGGGGTGEGGNFLIGDDVLKAQDAFTGSKQMEEVNDWWDKTMSTRGNDPKKTVRGLVMQRLHSGDLTQYLIDKMLYEEGTRYEVLCLPAEYEPNRSFLTTGWEDPRTEPGELLWPERFDEAAMRKLKNDLGEDAAGQLQQRPTSAEGGIFQKAWWGIPSHGQDEAVVPINRYRLDDNNVVARWLLYDTAFKDKDSNDPSACSVWELLDDYRLRLRHQWNKRIISALLPDLIKADIEEWDTDGLLRDVIIEDKGSGITTVQTLSATADFAYRDRIIGFPVNQSKEYRANLASIWCYRSCILLPYPEPWNASWFTTFLDPDKGQLFLFPNALHDDLVDTFSMGIIYLENYLKMGWQGRQEQS